MTWAEIVTIAKDDVRLFFRPYVVAWKLALRLVQSVAGFAAR